MKIANVKGMVTKLMLAGLVAGVFVVANQTTAQAQQFAVSAQFGQPAYVADHDGYRYDRDDYYRQREELREREAREEFLSRQAYIQHEQWERAHHFDRDHDYR
jgi:hypothetical protein